MSETNKFSTDNTTKVFRRPSDEEIINYKKEEDLKKEENLRYKRRQAIEELENERINNIKEKKEKKTVYKEAPVEYYEEEIPKEKGKNGCCFGCFLLLVALASFLFAGYVVFKGLL